MGSGRWWGGSGVPFRVFVFCLPLHIRSLPNGEKRRQLWVPYRAHMFFWLCELAVAVRSLCTAPTWRRFLCDKRTAETQSPPFILFFASVTDKSTVHTATQALCIWRILGFCLSCQFPVSICYSFVEDAALLRASSAFRQLAQPDNLAVLILLGFEGTRVTTVVPRARSSRR